MLQVDTINVTFSYETIRQKSAKVCGIGPWLAIIL